MVKKNNRVDGDVKLFQKWLVSHCCWIMNHRHRIALKIDHRRGLVSSLKLFLVLGLETPFLFLLVSHCLSAKNHSLCSFSIRFQRFSSAKRILPVPLMLAIVSICLHWSGIKSVTLTNRYISNKVRSYRNQNIDVISNHPLSYWLTHARLLRLHSKR